MPSTEKTIRAVLAAALLLWASQAGAQDWLSPYDNHIYSSPYEPPIPMPLGIRPLNILPPLGTSSCRQVPMCDSRGARCAWVNVCR